MGYDVMNRKERSLCGGMGYHGRLNGERVCLGNRFVLTFFSFFFALFLSLCVCVNVVRIMTNYTFSSFLLFFSCLRLKISRNSN